MCSHTTTHTKRTRMYKSRWSLQGPSLPALQTPHSHQPGLAHTTPPTVSDENPDDCSRRDCCPLLLLLLPHLLLHCHCHCYYYCHYHFHHRHHLVSVCVQLLPRGSKHPVDPACWRNCKLNFGCQRFAWVCQPTFNVETLNTCAHNKGSLTAPWHHHLQLLLLLLLLQPQAQPLPPQP